MQQEITTLRDCRHPNVVSYFGSYLRWDTGPCGTREWNLTQMLGCPIVHIISPSQMVQRFKNKTCLEDCSLTKKICCAWIFLALWLCFLFHCAVGMTGCGSAWNTVEGVPFRRSTMVRFLLSSLSGTWDVMFGQHSPKRGVESSILSCLGDLVFKWGSSLDTRVGWRGGSCSLKK